MKAWKHLTTGKFYSPQATPMAIDDLIAVLGFGAAADFELVDFTPEMIPRDLEKERSRFLTAWNRAVNLFILQFLDIGSQISLLAEYSKIQKKRVLNEITLKDEELEVKLDVLDAWKNAVMAYYYQRKDLLRTAGTLAELDQAFDASEFLTKYGLDGSVHPVPAITLEGVMTGG